MKKDEKKELEQENIPAPEKKDEGHEKTERESFEEEKKAYMSEKLEFEAARILADEGMPVSFAKLLAGENSEATSENVAMFKKAFMKAVEEAVSERLKGSVPKTGGTDMQTNDPFLSGFGI